MTHMRPAAYPGGMSDGSILQQTLRSNENMQQPGGLQPEYNMTQHHSAASHQPYNPSMMPQYNGAPYPGQSQPNMSYPTGQPYYSNVNNNQMRPANPFQPHAAMQDDLTNARNQYLAHATPNMPSTSQQQQRATTPSNADAPVQHAPKAAPTHVPTEPPKAPQKPLIPYLRFSKTVWETVRADNPGISFAEIGKVIGRRWRECPDDVKEKYAEEFAKDKEKYAQAQKAYLESPEYLAWLKHKKQMEEEEAKAEQRAKTPAVDPGRAMTNPLGGSHGSIGQPASSHHGPLEELQSMSQRIMSGPKNTASGSGHHSSTTPAEPDDDADDHLRSRHVASTRYRRNHKLMAEVFSDAIVPDGRMIVSEQRVQLLRKNVQSLTHHQEKLLSDQKELLEKHEIKKRKLEADNEAFAEKWQKVKEECRPVSKDQYQAMVDKYYAMYEEHVANYKAQQNAALLNAQAQQQAFPPAPQVDGGSSAGPSPQIVNNESADAEMTENPVDHVSTEQAVTNVTSVASDGDEDKSVSQPEVVDTQSDQNEKPQAHASEDTPVETSEERAVGPEDSSSNADGRSDEQPGISESKVSGEEVAVATVENGSDNLYPEEQMSSPREDGSAMGVGTAEPGGNQEVGEESMQVSKEAFAADTPEVEKEKTEHTGGEEVNEEAEPEKDSGADIDAQISHDKSTVSGDIVIKEESSEVKDLAVEETANEESTAKAGNPPDHVATENEVSPENVTDPNSVISEEEDNVDTSAKISNDQAERPADEIVAEAVAEIADTSAHATDELSHKWVGEGVDHRSDELAQSEAAPELRPEDLEGAEEPEITRHDGQADQHASEQVTKISEESPVGAEDSGGQGYADFRL
ncbi:hypothetical protein RvY_10646 [Ramazzottius varieornatus]|uniref:HMG box domain-containing protein n=1 Tax=Ramazzottius varieornatus TaxID=947166 RepID=A0A1D1VFW7_RAMVA|nr:hypothetical protein RvY_10646 [Ramazzottius varieornatus]